MEVQLPPPGCAPISEICGSHQLPLTTHQTTPSAKSAVSGKEPPMSTTVTSLRPVPDLQSDHPRSDPADLSPAPTAPQPKTGKTNSPTTRGTTDPLPPAAGAARQIDKTNCPASQLPTGTPPAAQIDKTNSPALHAPIGAPLRTSAPDPQIDKTNSPTLRVTTDAAATAQIDKTNSPAARVTAGALPAVRINKTNSPGHYRDNRRPQIDKTNSPAAGAPGRHDNPGTPGTMQRPHVGSDALGWRTATG